MVLILGGHTLPRWRRGGDLKLFKLVQFRNHIFDCPPSKQHSNTSFKKSTFPGVASICPIWCHLLPGTASFLTSHYDCTDVSMIARFHRNLSTTFQWLLDFIERFQRFGTSKLDAWRMDKYKDNLSLVILYFHHFIYF